MADKRQIGTAYQRVKVMHTLTQWGGVAYYKQSGGELWIKVGITLVSVDNFPKLGADGDAVRYTPKR